MVGLVLAAAPHLSVIPMRLSVAVSNNSGSCFLVNAFPGIPLASGCGDSSDHTHFHPMPEQSRLGCP